MKSIRLSFLMLVYISLLVGCSPLKVLTVEVENTLPFDRNRELISLDYTSIVKELALPDSAAVVILNADNKQVIYQITSKGELLFPVSVAARSTAQYRIQRGQPEAFQSVVYGRLIPERYDDFAWENDRIAFRTYGPALKAIDGPSNGVDVFLKRVDYPIIDKWYDLSLNKAQDYHTDRGEGLDCYKVGRTLGSGMPAPLVSDSLVLGENFVTSHVLENGPLRFSFRLTYAPLNVNGVPVVETRVITLDAHSSFNQMEVTYTGDFDSLSIAAGLTLHEGEGDITMNDKNVSVSQWEFMSDEVGYLSNALVFSNITGSRVLKVSNHAVITVPCQPEKPLVYYFGAGWSKWGYPTQTSWLEAVDHQAAIKKEPLKFKINLNK